MKLHFARKGWLVTVTLLVLSMAMWQITCSNKDPYRKHFTHRNYQIDSRPFHVAERGDKRDPAVIYVHGSPGSWNNGAAIALDPQIDGKVWFAALDRPGFGGSSEHRWQGSLAEQADFVRQLIEASENESGVILIGHSYGAPIAVKLAAQCPERVRALILIGAAVDPDLEKIKWFQKLADTRIARWVLPKMWETSNDELLPLKAELEVLDSEWDAVKATVVMIHGKKDRLVPYAQMHYVKAHVSSERFWDVTMPERGHFIPWQDPDVVASIVADLLAN